MFEQFASYDLSGPGGIVVDPQEVLSSIGVDPIRSTTIEELDLTVRTYNCLKRDGIATVGELMDRTEPELLEIRNFGSKSVEEIR